MDEKDNLFVRHLFKRVDSLYILDGHHRTEGSLAHYQAEKERALKDNLTLLGTEPWQYLFAVVMPAS